MTRGRRTCASARGCERYPLLAGTGWGEVTNAGDTVSFRVLGGTVRIAEVSLPAGKIDALHVDDALVALTGPVTLTTGQELTATVRP